MLAKKNALVTLFFICSLSAFSQLKKKKVAVGFNSYTVAPGFHISKELKKDKLVLTYTANLIRILYPQFVVVDINLPDSFNIQGVLDIGRVGINGAYYIKNRLAVVAGLQYNIFNSDADISLKNDYLYQANINGILATIPLSKDLIGSVNVKTKSKKIAFTSGLSYGYFIPKSKWGFRFEAGIIHQGEIKVEVEHKIFNFTFLGSSYNYYLNSEPDVKKAITDYENYVSKYETTLYSVLSLNYKIK